MGSEARDLRSAIVDVAARLFYASGVRATGVESIIAEADIAKATFYHYFPSKEDLVVAWLAHPHARWFVRVRERVDRKTSSPEKRLTAYFDVLGEWFAEPGFRGCPFTNTVAENPEPHHPARVAFAEMAGDVEEFFRGNASRAGFRDARRLGAQLFLLVPGAISVAVARGSAEPAKIARGAATHLIASHPRRR